MDDEQYLKLAVEQAKKSVNEGGFPAVAYWSGISMIVFGCRKTDWMTKKGYYEGFTDINKVNKENNRKIEMIFLPDFEQEMLHLIKSWEEKNGL